MGPRLGRVEYLGLALVSPNGAVGFNGATLRTRGIRADVQGDYRNREASMGPRLGRVEYGPLTQKKERDDGRLQWGHA